MRHRIAASAVAAVALFGVLGQTAPAPTAVATGHRCGLTTLDATIVFDTGALRCGPAQPITIRTELHRASTNPTAVPIAAFIAMTDFQLPDEESPLRGEFLDGCGDIPTKAAFRWNDTLLPALLNSQVRAANDIVRTGGPVTGMPIGFAVQLGDASENTQYNEVRQFIDILDGGTSVDPNSGGPSYEGNQGRDPYPSPVAEASLRDLGNRSFFAPGLRRPDGSPLPWFTVAGNHDVKVRGTVPNNDAWRTVAKAFVTGNLMVNDLPPDQKQRVCADPKLLINPAFWAEIAATPGAARLITPDANRRLLDRGQWAAEHAATRGLPAGHGLSARTRCKNATGAALPRLCWSADLAPTTAGEPALHLIALDDSPDEGLDTGNIDEAQWEWLGKDLRAHSSCAYPSDDAPTCSDTTGHTGSLIIVLSHHTITTDTNAVPASDGHSGRSGADLEKLLLRYPNVILHADGHTHRNKVWQHSRPGSKPGGYWELNTSAVADFPHQSRVVEIVDNRDGTLSIFGTSFDAAAPVDPHLMRWADDATPETSGAYGALRSAVNEEMLASIGRWIGANDPQSGAAVAPAVTADDKNVELVLTHPSGGLRAQPPRRNLPVSIPRNRRPYHPFFPGFFAPPPTVRVPYATRPGPSQFPPPLPQPYGSYAGPTHSIGVPGHSGRLPTSWYVVLLLGAAGPFWLRRGRVRREQVGL